MKKIVVYYSMTGNCEYVAEKIREKTKADVLRIKPIKEYPSKGFRKFFVGGKSAVMKELPTLEEYKFDSSKYDEIIFGLPVWASSVTPPMRTFIVNNKEALKGKKLSVFVTMSGNGANKVIEDMRKILDIDKFDNKLVLIDPKGKIDKEKDKQIEEFCNKL